MVNAQKVYCILFREKCNNIFGTCTFSAMADPDEGDEDEDALDEVPVPVPTPGGPE